MFLDGLDIAQGRAPLALVARASCGEATRTGTRSRRSIDTMLSRTLEMMSPLRPSALMAARKPAARRLPVRSFSKMSCDRRSIFLPVEPEDFRRPVDDGLDQARRARLRADGGNRPVSTARVMNIENERGSP